MDYKEKVIALLNSKELSKEQKGKLEEIFPELKESEDMPQQQEWYAIKDGYKYQNFGLCPDGLYHWEKDLSYAGFTAQELIDMGAE